MSFLVVNGLSLNITIVVLHVVLVSTRDSLELLSELSFFLFIFVLDPVDVLFEHGSLLLKTFHSGLMRLFEILLVLHALLFGVLDLYLAVTLLSSDLRAENLHGDASKLLGLVTFLNILVILVLLGIPVIGKGLSLLLQLFQVVLNRVDVLQRSIQLVSEQLLQLDN